MACALCGKQARYACGRCGLALYCDTGCQRRDLADHRAACIRVDATDTRAVAEARAGHLSERDCASAARRLGVLLEKVGIDWWCAGMDVELEHGTIDQRTDVTGDDPAQTGKIVLAHLQEGRDYYQRLEQMERLLDDEQKGAMIGPAVSANPAGQADPVRVVMTFHGPRPTLPSVDDIVVLETATLPATGTAGRDELDRLWDRHGKVAHAFIHFADDSLTRSGSTVVSVRGTGTNAVSEIDGERPIAPFAPSRLLATLSPSKLVAAATAARERGGCPPDVTFLVDERTDARGGNFALYVSLQRALEMRAASGRDPPTVVLVQIDTGDGASAPEVVRCIVRAAASVIRSARPLI